MMAWFTNVAVSADGQRIVAADKSGTVKSWDAATGQEKLILQGRTEAGIGKGQRCDQREWPAHRLGERRRPEGMGRHRGAGGSSPSGCLWGNMKGFVPRGIEGLAISGNYLVAVGGAQQDIYVWDTTTGLEMFTLKAPSLVMHGVALSLPVRQSSCFVRQSSQ